MRCDSSSWASSRRSSEMSWPMIRMPAIARPVEQPGRVPQERSPRPIGRRQHRLALAHGLAAANPREVAQHVRPLILRHAERQEIVADRLLTGQAEERLRRRG